jgi:hypothetical protein
LFSFLSHSSSFFLELSLLSLERRIRPTSQVAQKTTTGAGAAATAASATATATSSSSGTTRASLAHHAPFFLKLTLLLFKIHKFSTPTCATAAATVPSSDLKSPQGEIFARLDKVHGHGSHPCPDSGNPQGLYALVEVGVASEAVLVRGATFSVP